MIIFQFLRHLFTGSHRPGNKLCIALLSAVALNILFGFAFYFTESPTNQDLTPADSIWWAMVTMTTVGYGDYYPETIAGRFLVAYPCFILGIGLIGYIVGTIVEILLELINNKKKGLAKMSISNHLVICNCSSVQKVLRIVEEFRANSGDAQTPVVVISGALDELPSEFREAAISWISGLPSSESALERARLTSASAVIILADRPEDLDTDSRNYANASLVQHLTSSLDDRPRIVIEVARRENLGLMQRLNADGLVPIEGFSEKLLVQELVSPGLREIFDQLVTYQSGSELYLVEHQLHGRKIRDLQIEALRKSDTLQILGIVLNSEVSLTSDCNRLVEDGSRLLILARKKSEFFDFQSKLLNP